LEPGLEGWQGPKLQIRTWAGRLARVEFCWKMQTNKTIQPDELFPTFKKVNGSRKKF